MEERRAPMALVIVFLVIILGLIGYIAVDKLFLSKTKEAPTIVAIDDVNIDLNALYKIEDILTMFDNAFNDSNSDYFGYPYKIDKRLVASKFDNGAALFASMHDDMVGASTAQYIIGGKVKYNFGQIFGKNLEYKPANVNAGRNYNIIYNESNGNFTYTAQIVPNVYKDEYIAKNTKTELEEETVKITRRVGYIEYQSEEGSSDITKAAIYTNSDKKKFIGTLTLRNNYLNLDEVLDKYGSRLSKYVYIFKQNSSSLDDYSFFAIEKG